MADIEADVWADGERDLLQEIAALTGAPCVVLPLPLLAPARARVCVEAAWVLSGAATDAQPAGAADDVSRRTRLLENEIRVLKDENQRLSLEQQGNKEKLKDNLEKIKLNKQLPYLVGNVVEVLDQVPEVRVAGASARPLWPTWLLFAPTLSVT